MMKDMNVSENLNQQFRHFSYYSVIDFDFNIKVLTSGNWSNDSTKSH